MRDRLLVWVKAPFPAFAHTCHAWAIIYSLGMNSIDIAICLHLHDCSDVYAQALAALYVSAYTRTTRPLRFFIVHDQTLDDITRSRLVCLFSSRRHDKVCFVSIHGCPDALEAGQIYQNSRYSPAPIWRSFFPELIPSQRFISLDADMLFASPPEYIYDCNMHGQPVAARPRGGVPLPSEYLQQIGTPPHRYFRMGICLIDNHLLSKNQAFMSDRLDFILNRLPKINSIRNLPDQSVYNFFLHDSWTMLPICLLPEGAFHQLGQGGRWDREISEAAGIVYDVKGWKNKTPYSLHYWGYLLHTPWREQALMFWRSLQETPAPNEGKR